MEVFSMEVAGLGFFKKSDIEKLDINIEDEVIVLQGLDEEVNEEEFAHAEGELSDVPKNKEHDEISEFIELSKKDKLTKEEKKRLKKLIRYIDGQTTTIGEIVRGWIGVTVISVALVYYFSLPIKIHEYKNNQASQIQDFLVAEEAINAEYEALKETTTKPYAVVSIEALNVRAEPDEASTKLGQLKKNEEVEVIEELEGQDFIKISYQNQSGYIHKDFVEIINKSIEVE